MTEDGRRADTHGAVVRGAPITIEVDGEPIRTYTGETLAGAMLAAGKRVFRKTGRNHAARGVFCGMGVCYDCVMVVNGVPNTRACMTPVAPGMRAATQQGPEVIHSPVPDWE